MSQDPFAAPAPPGEGIKWEPLNGCLLLIEPKGAGETIQTTYGESEAVRADVAVLDGQEAGTVYHDTLVFPKVLQGQLKSQIGQKVLGRLGQGQAKQGQSPPWLLSEATDQDKQLGVQWLNQAAGQQMAQPAPAQQPAAVQQQAPAGQQWQQGPQQQPTPAGQVPFP